MNTYVVDIDNTIAKPPKKFKNVVKWNDFLIESDYNNCEPINEVIDKVNSLFDKGHKIILFTARGMRTFNHDKYLTDKYHRPILERWLKKHNVKYSELILGKPWGSNVFYVDDKNLSINEFLSHE